MDDVATKGSTIRPAGPGMPWIRPDSELARMVLDHDWSSTSIGPMEGWPIALRTAVSACLSTHFPVLVLWGPELVKIYNDGYAHMVGPDKHPRALGAPAAEIWPEIWDRIGPMFDSVLTTGEATWCEHELLAIERNGFVEECYFTWSYSPLFDDDGAVNGILDISVETTNEVVNQRRLACLADLNATLAEVDRTIDACIATVKVLSRHTDDIVAADVHLHLGDQLVRVASNRRTRPRSVVTDTAEQALRSGRSEVAGLECEDRPAAHYAAPFGHQDDRLHGVLVASLNPMRPFDTGYRTFIDLITRTLGNVFDRVQRRTEALGQIQAVNDALQKAMLSPVTDTPTFAARYIPAANNLSVGGDWYDVIDLPDGRRAMVVGDCVGHGLESATAMAQLRSATRALLLEGRDPASTITSLETFADSVEGAKCASITCVIRDRTDNTITYCRAGHPPPLLFGASGPEWLDDPGGPLLGVAPETDRHNSVRPYADGDLLVMYTDGLVERRDEAVDDRLARLVAVVAENAAADVAPLADLLLSELVTDDTEDDVVVVVKRFGATDGDT